LSTETESPIPLVSSLPNDPQAKLKPAMAVPDPLHSLEQALQQHQAGNLDEADTLYQHILNSTPDNADALHLKGVLQHQKGNPKLAIDLIQSAIHLQPLNTGFYLNLAKVWLSQGDYSNALTQYAHILEHTPDHPEALLQSTEILLALCETPQADENLFQSACQLATRCLSLRPYPLEVAYNLARLYQKRHHLDQAIPLYHSLLNLELERTQVEGHQKNRLPKNLLKEQIAQNLGAAYQALGQNTLAEEAFQSGLTQCPKSITLNLALGMLLYDQGKQSECLPYFDTLIALEPDNSLWRYKKKSLCPIFPESIEAIQAFRNQFQHSIETDLVPWLQQETPPVNLEELLSLSLEPSFFLSYQGEDDLPLKSRLGDLWAETLPRWYPEAFKNIPIQMNLDNIEASAAERHIGILVTEKHEGIFIKLMSPLLNALSVNQPDHEKSDHQNNTLRWTVFAPQCSIQQIQDSVKNPNAFQWVILPDSFLEKIQTVKQVGLDALLYFEVGTDSTNYFLPFFQLAPIQCTTWGVPVTTGIPAMQYFISSQFIDPPNSQALYRETLIQLETLPTVFPKSKTGFAEHSPAISKTISNVTPKKPKRIYFCPQNLFKLHPQMDHLFRQILEQDPEGEIHLISGRDPAWQTMIQNRMALSIDSERLKRIMFLPRLSESEFLNTMATADVILDTLHYGGGTTALEAISVGTPMVILPSNHTRAKMALGCINALCQTSANSVHLSEDSDTLLLQSLLVENETAYVEKALWIAQHPKFKADFQKALSTTQHHLFENQKAAKAFERFFTSLPQHPQKQFGKIQHFLNQQKWDSASTFLQAALKEAPQDGELWAQLSYCQYQKHCWEESLNTTEKALSLLGENAILLNQKIRILQQISPEALDTNTIYHISQLYESALKTSPEDETSWHNYCCFLKRTQQWEAAHALAQHYQSQFPNHPAPYFHLGEIYFHQQLLPDAARAFHTALEQFNKASITQESIPLDLGQVWLHLGHVLNHPQYLPDQHTEKSISHITPEHAFEQAVSANPQLKEGWLALTDFYQSENRWEKTLKASEQYHHLSLPKNLLTKNSDLFSMIRQSSLRPIIPENNAQLTAAQDQMAMMLQTLEEMIYNQSTLPKFSLDELAFCHAEPNFYWIYDDTPQLETRKRYARLFEHWLNLMHPEAYQWEPQTTKTEGKRLGFWVTEGHENVFHKLLLQLIEDMLDQSINQIILAGRPHSLDYLKHKMAPEYLEKIQWCPCPDGLHHTLNLLREQALDVMFWDEVGSQSINYFLTMLGVARYQLTANGYPITTGLSKMDFFLSSQQINTPDLQAWFSEQLILLDSPPWQFHTPDAQSDYVSGITHSKLKALLANPNHPIISCPQSLPKFHPSQDPLYADILSANPKAKLLLLESKHPHWNQCLNQRFEKNGINIHEQIVWLPRLSFHDYLGLLQGSHFLLDTLAYNGSITSQEALTFGTPIITADGTSYVSRVSGGCYRWIHDNFNIHEDVSHMNPYLAKDGVEYVQKAIQQMERVTQDPHAFQHQKQELQEKSKVINQRGQGAKSLLTWLETLP
jgi:protein O-GlcNAc transferase